MEKGFRVKLMTSFPSYYLKILFAIQSKLSKNSKEEYSRLFSKENLSGAIWQRLKVHTTFFLSTAILSFLASDIFARAQSAHALGVTRRKGQDRLF